MVDVPEATETMMLETRGSRCVNIMQRAQRKGRGRGELSQMATIQAQEDLSGCDPQWATALTWQMSTSDPISSRTDAISCDQVRFLSWWNSENLVCLSSPCTWTTKTLSPGV